MAISDGAKRSLDWAIEKISNQGHTVWGFILSPDASDIQPFSNAGDSVDVFIHNLREGLRVLEETNSAKGEAN